MSTETLKPARACKLALSIIATASLLGCNTTSKLSGLTAEDDGFSQAISSHEAALSYNEQQEIGPQLAVVQLRDRPTGILSATERQYRNGFSQRIVYPVTSGVWGENSIELRVTGKRTKRKPNEKLILHSSRLSVILDAARTALGDKSVTLSEDNLLRNAYGPYGLIYQKPNAKIGCLFGWQILLNDDGKNPHHLLPSESAGWPARQGLSYHVRYCAKGLSLTDARDVMERVYLKPEFGRIWFDGADEEQIDPITTASLFSEEATVPKPVRKKKRKTNPVQTASRSASEELVAPTVPLPDNSVRVAAPANSVAVVPSPTIETGASDDAVVVPLP